MLSPDLRLRLIDQATERLGHDLSQASLCLFVRHLRRTDLNHEQWHRCSDLATSGACSHHRARAAAAELVNAGLLERQYARRFPGAKRTHTAYRLLLPDREGAAL
ncbi:hypothetical protein AB0G49_14070 [Streptomyces longwoodensis]|uniref:hypothetical protein n=1 Tax=Streptomyces longwoodensis TaxID=68231 RepID=UPI0033E8FD1B